MSIYEMGYSIGQDTLPGTYKVGGWHHSANLTDVAGNPHSGNYGFYFVADQLIFPEQAGSDQGLGLFVQIGKVPDDRNMVDLYVGGGVNYHGLLPGREEDDFGIAVGHASISENMIGPGVDSAETVIELTYLANLLPWFTIQPDFQYIINPGADPAIKNALVGGVRFGIVFK
jgi:porin